MEKLDGKSMDLEKHSIEKIKELFPEVVTEGRIDFDKLRLILGDEVDESVEKYQFTWNGKSQTIKLAQKPSTGTLRPAKEESKDWDTTENLYIEGDNLEVLKQLQKTYFGKIKMIYIDPPYNTGGDFVYKDDFKDSIQNYKEQTNQTSRSNADTSGRYHTDWLNMMYSRLMLAKNLLSDDGVIFISIDENEVHNLRKISDEILGESNFVSSFMYEKTQHFGRQKLNVYSNAEYILCYAKVLFKNENLSDLLVEKIKTELEDAPLYNASNPDNIITFPKKAVIFNIKDGVYNNTTDAKYALEEPVEVKDGLNVNAFKLKFRSRWSAQKVLDEADLGCKYWVKSENFAIRAIYQEGKTSKSAPKQLLFTNSNNPMCTISRFNVKVGSNETGSSDVKKILNEGIFSYPKPVSLISYLTSLLWNSRESDFHNEFVVLDFFSGSATTAHAVMKLNAEDGGNRKFIMVQLPEKTDEKSEAYKAGYKNICEIGKERIRRAGEQIKQEMEKEGKDSSKLDLGFKVFKLDDTNIKEWDSSQEVTESTLFDQQEVFKEGRTTEDVLYEILLKHGVFDMPVSETLFNAKVAYDIGRGDMIVALFDDITSEDVKAIAEKKPRVVIFKDSGFENDNVKLNALHNLEKQGVQDVKSI